MNIALVHDWLTGMRGGERCLEVLCELFPNADIYTLMHVKDTVSSTIEQHPIRTSFLQHLPCAATRYRYYLPLFPCAIESFDFTGYDLVISLSHCVAKGVRVPDGVFHLAYMHTPMRYIWDQYDEYFGEGRAGWLTRRAMALLRRRLQDWDVASSGRVNSFVANSQHVANRIERFYGRKAAVLYPPVNWHAFQVSSHDDGFYLMVTAFAPYKRVDLAIEACNRLGRPLKIIGFGQDERPLRQLAGPTVEFLGWQPDEVVRDYYARCTALLFPGEEDFGIVPLEVMACGKPVIAYGKGGALETVVPLNPGPNLELRTWNCEPLTGVFFYEQTVEALSQAVDLFERHRDRFDPETIRAHVASFDRARFKEQMRDLIIHSYEAFRQTQPC